MGGNPKKWIMDTSDDYKLQKGARPFYEQYESDVQTDTNPSLYTNAPGNVLVAPENTVIAQTNDLAGLYKKRNIPQRGVVDEIEIAKQDRANNALNAINALITGEGLNQTAKFLNPLSAIVGGAKNAIDTEKGISKERNMTSYGASDIPRIAVNSLVNSANSMIGAVPLVAGAMAGGELLGKATTPAGAYLGEKIGGEKGKEIGAEIGAEIGNVGGFAAVGMANKPLFLGMLTARGFGYIADKIGKGIGLTESENKLASETANLVGFIAGGMAGSKLENRPKSSKMINDLINGKKPEVKVGKTNELQNQKTDAVPNEEIGRKGETAQPERGKEGTQEQAPQTTEGLKDAAARLRGLVTPKKEKTAPPKEEVLFNEDRFTATQKNDGFSVIRKGYGEDTKFKTAEEAIAEAKRLDEVWKPKTEKPIEQPENIATEPTNPLAPAVPPIESGKSETTFGNQQKIDNISDMKNPKGMGELPSEQKSQTPEGKINDLQARNLVNQEIREMERVGKRKLKNINIGNRVGDGTFYIDEYIKKRLYELTKPEYDYKDINIDDIYVRNQFTPGWEVSSLHTPNDTNKWRLLNGISAIPLRGGRNDNYVYGYKSGFPESIEDILTNPPDRPNFAGTITDDYTAFYTGEEQKIKTVDGVVIKPDKLLAVWDNNNNKLIVNNIRGLRTDNILKEKNDFIKGQKRIENLQIGDYAARYDIFGELLAIEKIEKTGTWGGDRVINGYDLSAFKTLTPRIVAFAKKQGIDVPKEISYKQPDLSSQPTRAPKVDAQKLATQPSVETVKPPVQSEPEAVKPDLAKSEKGGEKPESIQEKISRQSAEATLEELKGKDFVRVTNPEQVAAKIKKYTGEDVIADKENGTIQLKPKESLTPSTTKESGKGTDYLTDEIAQKVADKLGGTKEDILNEAPKNVDDVFKKENANFPIIKAIKEELKPSPDNNRTAAIRMLSEGKKPREIAKALFGENHKRADLEQVVKWRNEANSDKAIFMDSGVDKNGTKVLGNFNKQREAIEFAKTNGGKVSGYLGGKYERGWTVEKPKDIEAPKVEPDVNELQDRIKFTRGGREYTEYIVGEDAKSYTVDSFGLKQIPKEEATLIKGRKTLEAEKTKVEPKANEIVEEVTKPSNEFTGEFKRGMVLSDPIAKGKLGENLKKSSDFLQTELQRLQRELIDKSENLKEADKPEFKKALNGEKNKFDFDKKSLEKIGSFGNEKLEGEYKLEIPGDGEVTLKNPTLSYLVELEGRVKYELKDRKESTSTPLNRNLAPDYFESMDKYGETLTENETNLTEAKRTGNKKLIEVFTERKKQLEKADTGDISDRETFSKAQKHPYIKEKLQDWENYHQYEAIRDYRLLEKHNQVDNPKPNLDAINIVEEIKQLEEYKTVDEYIKGKTADEAKFKEELKPFYKENGYLKKGLSNTQSRTESSLSTRLKTVQEDLRDAIKNKKEIEKLLNPESSAKSQEQGDAFKRLVSDEAYQAAKKTLNTVKLYSTPFDVEHMKALATYAAYHFENGARTFADYSKKMMDEFGWDDWIKPHLEEAWKEFEAKTKPKIETAETKVRGLAKSSEAKGVENNDYRSFLEGIPEEGAIQTAVEELKPNDVNYNVFKSAQNVRGNPLVETMQEIIFDSKERALREQREFDDKLNPLLKAARDSRGKYRFFKNDENVFDYLENRTPEKFKELTPEEQKLAEHVQAFLDDPEVQRVMTHGNTLKNYITHIRRPFWERVYYDGFGEAVKTVFRESDNNLINKALADIDNAIAKKKWNPFEKTRTDKLTDYSKDLGIILDTYVKLYHIKKNLDPYRKLTKTLANVLGQEGLPKSEVFLKRYIKTSMGEKIDNITPEFLSRTISGLMTYTGARYLAVNLPAGVLNTLSGVGDNFISMNLPEFARGIKRFEQGRGQKILKQQDVVDFAELENIRSVRSALGKGINALLFSPMRGIGRIPFGEKFIQGSQYLGYLTREEFARGKISEARHREIIENIANTQGSYRESLKPDALRYKILAPAFQFRLWTGAKVGARIKRLKGAFNEIKGFDINNLKGDKTKNLRSMAKEAALIGTIFYLYFNKDKNKDIQLLGDGLQDLYSFLAPNRIARGLENIAPITKTIADILRLGGTISEELTGDGGYKVNSKYGKKGESKIPSKTADILPLRNITKPMLEREKTTIGKTKSRITR